MRFAFLTSQQFASLYEDDLLAVAALEHCGHSVTPAVWDHTSVNVLNGFDAVVMRSPWDWYTRTFEFQSFLERLGEVTVPLVNPHAMLLEFYDKTYLRTLEQRGVPIVPTRWLTRDALETLPELVRSAGWSRAVVKPTVSANASQTYLFSANEARRVMTSLRSKSDHDAYLVQPYLSEIETDGEWSLMFFGGEYSHSVRKLPKAGDFRVQSGHGGRSEPMVPSQLILDAAHRAVNLGVPTSMYARVDGVVHDGQFLVMELEVIEPELFFRADPQAAGRFADRLLAYVKA